MRLAGTSGMRRGAAIALGVARPLGQLGLYLLVCLVTAAALATPVYRLLEDVGLVGLEYEEVAFRTLEAIAFGWLVLWVKWRGGRLAAWGFRGPPASFGRELALGYAAGVLTLLVLWAALMLLEIRAYRPGGLDLLPGAIAKGLVVGSVVALVEETLFRGGMQAALRPRSPRASAWPALCLVAGVYALAHFIKPASSLAPAEVDWASGPEVLWDSLQRLGAPGTLDSTLCLLAAGISVGLVRERTGRIAMSIGMHAGWVTVIVAARQVSVLSPSGGASGLVGTYDGVIGWMGLVVFVAVVLICRRWPAFPHAGRSGDGAGGAPEVVAAER